MTHFFFSLIREPATPSERTEMAPLMFYFDTHIITQVNLNVKHTVFDKVEQCWTNAGLTGPNVSLHFSYQPLEARSAFSVDFLWSRSSS